MFSATRPAPAVGCGRPSGKRDQSSGHRQRPTLPKSPPKRRVNQLRARLEPGFAAAEPEFPAPSGFSVVVLRRSAPASRPRANAENPDRAIKRSATDAPPRRLRSTLDAHSAGVTPKSNGQRRQCRCRRSRPRRPGARDARRADKPGGPRRARGAADTGRPSTPPPIVLSGAEVRNTNRSPARSSTGSIERRAAPRTARPLDLAWPRLARRLRPFRRERGTRSVGESRSRRRARS